MASLGPDLDLAIMGGIDGRTFNFKPLGDLLMQWYRLALEGTVAALDTWRMRFSSNRQSLPSALAAGWSKVRWKCE